MFEWLSTCSWCTKHPKATSLNLWKIAEISRSKVVQVKVLVRNSLEWLSLFRRRQNQVDVIEKIDCTNEILNCQNFAWRGWTFSLLRFLFLFVAFHVHVCLKLCHWLARNADDFLVTQCRAASKRENIDAKCFGGRWLLRVSEWVSMNLIWPFGVQVLTERVKKSGFWLVLWVSSWPQLVETVLERMWMVKPCVWVSDRSDRSVLLCVDFSHSVHNSTKTTLM